MALIIAHSQNDFISTDNVTIIIVRAAVILYIVGTLRLNSKKTLFPAERVSQKCFHEGGRKFFFFLKFFCGNF